MNRLMNQDEISKKPKILIAFERKMGREKKTDKGSSFVTQNKLGRFPFAPSKKERKKN